VIKLKSLLKEVSCECGGSCCKEVIVEKAVSKAQQKFMGMVHAIHKGELKGSEVSKDVKDAAKGMKKKSVKDYASTKHKGLPKKVKREDLQRLIAKYGVNKVRETIMALSPKSDKGYREPVKPDFEYDPEKVRQEGFGGELKGKDKQKFEKARKENAEQLGYKLTGTKDIKESIQEKSKATREFQHMWKAETKLRDRMHKIEQIILKDPTTGNQTLARSIKDSYKRNVTKFMREVVSIIKRIK